jgi:hypothetical protein
VIRKAIELQPAGASYHEQLTVIEIQRNKAQAALEAAQQEPSEQWREIALALARQIGGDRSAADAALRTLIEKDATIAPYQIAEVYALRNDAKATFEWLDLAWSNRDGGIQFLLYDPFILRYKNDPRFAAFCRKVGLPVSGPTPSVGIIRHPSAQNGPLVYWRSLRDSNPCYSLERARKLSRRVHVHIRICGNYSHLRYCCLPVSALLFSCHFM